MPSRAELRSLAQELEDAIARGADEARAWLASEQGRRYRAIAARALVLAAPLLPDARRSAGRGGRRSSAPREGRRPDPGLGAVADDGRPPAGNAELTRRKPSAPFALLP